MLVIEQCFQELNYTLVATSSRTKAGLEMAEHACLVTRNEGCVGFILRITPSQCLLFRAVIVCFMGWLTETTPH